MSSGRAVIRPERRLEPSHAQRLRPKREPFIVDVRHPRGTREDVRQLQSPERCEPGVVSISKMSARPPHVSSQVAHRLPSSRSNCNAITPAGKPVEIDVICLNPLVVWLSA